MRDDELDIIDVDQRAHTGPVPGDLQIDRALEAAYRRALTHHEGMVADDIPILGAADPEAFGLCVAPEQPDETAADRRAADDAT